MFQLLNNNSSDVSEGALEKEDLHQACREGKLDVVKYILTKGLADINSRGKKGQSPVMVAALNSQLELFNYLVEQGCSLCVSADHKYNVLHYACTGGNLSIIKSLVDGAKCDIETKGYIGRTPVMCAVSNGHRLVVIFLISKHCSLKAKDDHHSTILHVACIGGHVKMVNHIVSLGVSDIEGKGVQGRTPVMCAAMNGHISVVNFLISQNCNLKVVDNRKSTLLQVACEGGHVDMVKHILSLDMFDVDSKGFKGRAPVMYAVKCGHKSVVDFLISENCSLKAVDKDGSTLLYASPEGGHVNMVKYIISLGVSDIESKGFKGMTPLLYAVKHGKMAVVNFLISKHCNLQAVDKDGNTLLHVACEGGFVKMANYILSLSTSDIESKGFNGMTPVMYAVKHGQRAVVKFLISKHCKLQVVDKDGSTLLHIACAGGHVYMVKYILSLGVSDIESKDLKGKTPVMYAMLRGHKSVVDFLTSKH